MRNWNGQVEGISLSSCRPGVYPSRFQSVTMKDLCGGCRSASVCNVGDPPMTEHLIITGFSMSTMVTMAQETDGG